VESAARVEEKKVARRRQYRGDIVNRGVGETDTKIWRRMKGRKSRDGLGEII